MPLPKKKSTTSNTDPVVLEPPSSSFPDQHTFHEHLRALTRNAVRVVIEEVMPEELKQFLGAAWGECTPERKGYRNGTYTRDLATSSGPIEDLEIPRDREGHFHTQVFDRYSRYEPQVAEGLTQMFVAGVSTQKVGEFTQTLMGVTPSASTISRLNQTLTQQFEAWRERPLQEHWRILYLDGVHFSIRHGEKADSTAKYSKRYPEAVRSLREDEAHLLTFYQFPVAMHRHIQTTNAIESLFSNVRQRTDQIDVFTTETSCLAIVWATMQDIRLHNISV